MTLGERVKLVRNGLSQKDFAEKFGIAVSTLRRYETDVISPGADFLLAICKKYQLEPAWMLAGEGAMHKNQKKNHCINNIASDVSLENPLNTRNIDDINSNVKIPRWKNPDPEMFDYIPLAETQLSAGGGAFVISEEIEGYYAFRKNWLSRVASSNKNLVLMRVIGDSMFPTIQQDDTVMIDIGKRSIKEGMIYAIRFDSTVMIKRLTFRPGGRVLIISDNRQEYESYEADLKDLHLIGQVIFFCRTLATE